MKTMERQGKSMYNTNETAYDIINEDERHYICIKCKNEPMYFEGGPFENGWKYCPYCGLKIVEVLEQEKENG